MVTWMSRMYDSGLVSHWESASFREIRLRLQQQRQGEQSEDLDLAHFGYSGECNACPFGISHLYGLFSIAACCLLFAMTSLFLEKCVFKCNAKRAVVM